MNSDNYKYDIDTGLVYNGDGKPRLDIPKPEVQDYVEPSPQLQISMTDKCNLSCQYCAFRSRIGADDKPNDMPIDRAKKAINKFSEIVQSEKFLRIDYGLAGEPMLKRSLHPQLNSYVEEVFSNNSTNIIWAGTNTTNGTIFLNPKTASLIGPPMDISIDGPEDVHDKLRKYSNGKGTYKDVEKVARDVLKRHPDIGVSAVLTNHCTDFTKIFKHLKYELGFCNIYMKPVNLKHSENYGLNKDNLKNFKKGYTDLIEFFKGLPDAELLDAVLSLDKQDYFRRFFERVRNLSIQYYRCGAGKSGYYVDTNGLLYACAHFIGKSGYDIGNLDDGISMEHVSGYMETVDNKSVCQTCDVRYLCGGGCHYQSVLANDDITKPDEVKCDLIKHLCFLASDLLVHMHQRKDKFLDLLPSPYLIPKRLINEKADSQYKPQSSIYLGQKDSIKLDLSLNTECTTSTGKIGFELERSDNSLKLRFFSDREIEDISINLYSKNDVAGFTYQNLLANQFVSEYKYIFSSDNNVLLKEMSTRKSNVVTIPFKPKIMMDDVNTSTQINEGVWACYIPNINIAGINLAVNFANGGYAKLIKYEPFANLFIDDSTRSSRCCGGEFTEKVEKLSAINEPRLKDFVPITRFSALKENVC